MNFLRRIGLTLSASLFSIAIFLFATMLSLFLVFGTPAHLEKALSQSGIYNEAGSAILEKNQSKSDDTLSLTNPTVKAAVQDALPASTVEHHVDTVIDSTYAWMQGKTVSPNFTIDLTEIKGTISTNLSKSLTTKLQSLPVCPAGTVIPTSTAAILSLTCRPANVSVAKLVQAVEQQAEGNGIISESALTSQDIKNADGQPVYQQLRNVPKLYKNYVMALYVLPVIAVVTALGVIFFSKSRRIGVRRVGVTLVTTGLYATVFALLVLWLLHHYADNVSNQITAMASLQGKIVNVINVLASDLRRNWLIFGISYVMVGGLAWLLTHLIGRTRKRHEALSNPLSHNMDIPQAGTTFTPKSSDSVGEGTGSSIKTPSAPTTDKSEISSDESEPAEPKTPSISGSSEHKKDLK